MSLVKKHEKALIVIGILYFVTVFPLTSYLSTIFPLVSTIIRVVANVLMFVLLCSIVGAIIIQMVKSQSIQKAKEYQKM